MNMLTKTLIVLLLILMVMSGGVAHSDTVVEIAEITIVANRVPQSGRQIPHNVDTVSRKSITLQNGSMVSDVLQQISGINVGERGLRGEDLDIRMRGSDRDEVLVMYDGVPLEGNGESRAFFLNFLPMEFIERIEVIKGSQSVLYGSNAVGGVINIISKKNVASGPKSHASLMYTTNNSVRESVGTQWDFGKTHMNFGVVRDDSNLLDRFNDRSGTLGGHLALTGEVSDKIRVIWNFDGFFGRQNLAYDQINVFTGTPSLNSYVVPDDDIFRKIKWFQSQARVEADWTDRLMTRIQIAGNHLEETLANTNAGDTPVDETGAALTPNSQFYLAHSYRIHTDLFNQFRLFDGDKIKFDTQLGFNFIHDNLDFVNNSFPGDVGAGLPSTDAYPGAGEESGRENYAGYAQGLFYWNTLVLSAGVRVDHNTTFGNEWSPRFAAAYTVDKTDTTLRASYAEGFHAPTIAEFFDATIGGTVTALALKANQETTQSYEASLEQRLFQDRLMARSTWFYVKYNGLLDIVEAIDSASSWGLENDVYFNLIPKTKVGLNYTFNRTNNDDTGGELTLRPHHMAHAFVEVEPVKNLTVRPQTEYFSKRKNPETLSLTIGDFPVQAFNSSGQTGEFVAGHFVFDLLLNYRLKLKAENTKTVDFFVNVHNIFNERYENSFGYPAPGFRVAMGSRFAF